MKSRITRQRFQPLLAVAALLAALLPLGELIAAEPLAFGVLPRRNAQLTARLFTPLAEHLSAAIGRPVELILSKDYDAFSQSIANERFDIVHFNQFHYIKARFEHGYQVFARNREGGSDLIEAAIFTRSGSGVYRLADLKGRKVMFGGGRQAMISYIASRYLLREAGLQDDDYTSLIARNPPNAMVASFVGEADAAAAATHVRQLPVIR